MNVLDIGSIGPCDGAGRIHGEIGAPTPNRIRYTVSP